MLDVGCEVLVGPVVPLLDGGSFFYDLRGFVADPTSTHLRPFELEESSDVAGKTLVHT